MPGIFDDFDFTDFWDDSEYSIEAYVEETPSEELIASIEKELGYKLPASYIELAKMHNGGTPNMNCFPTSEPTCWAPDHIAITCIFGLGRDKNYSLCGEIGSAYMTKEWGYPEIGVCICDTPTGGHDMIMLDYTKNGKDGEPEVVHVDQENDFKITFLAKNFETFIRGLVSEDVYDTSEQELANTLETIRSGSFSTLLSGFLEKEKTTNFDAALRNILIQLTKEKGYFGLHDDALSYLVYDILFYLYAKNTELKSTKQYLKDYPDMLVFGDGLINTNGYAQDFVIDWMHDRMTKKEIFKKLFANVSFTQNFENRVWREMKKYENA